MVWLLLALVVFGITFVLPIASWLSIQSARRRIGDLERTVEDHARTIELLKRRPASSEAAAVPAAAVPARPAPVVAPPPPVAPPHPVPVTPPAASAPPAARVERPWPDLPPPAAKPVPPPVPPAPAPVENPWPERTQRPAAAAMTPAAGTAQESRPLTPPPPPVPPRRPLPVEPPPPPPPASEPFDWESLVGVKLFSAIAGIALLLAAIFFLRYSVQQGWLQPPVRVAIGIIVAIALLVACELKAARQYPATANALDASAIAILFATFFAAHSLWHLIPAPVAFALLALVTAVAVALSIRRESLFIAVLGLLGGFATPALLSTGENRPVPLFAYLFLLNVGLAWVSYRQVWPVLSWLTVIFTAVYQWGWVIKFLSTGQLSLAMGIFLLFPLVAIAAQVLGSRNASAAARDASASFERSALIASVLPLFFAVYLAVVPAYAGHPWLLLSFLLLLDAGLVAVAIARRQDLLAAAAALATLLVMAALLWTGYSEAARIPLVLFTALYALLFTFAPVAAARFERHFDDLGERVAYTGPLLLFAFAVVVRIDPAFANPWTAFAVLLALLVIIAVRAAVTEQGGLYFVAAFFAIAAQASWSAMYLDAARLRTAVMLYAAFGMVTLAAPIVARRAGRPFRPEAGTGLVVLASLPLLLFFAAGPVAPAALWALALLLAILNAAMFIESAAVGLPPVSFVGSVLSWAILATWWLRASGSVGILASLSVLTGMTLVTLGGYAWAQTRPAAAGAGASVPARFADGLFLGLMGHLFLLLLGLNPAWSIPPWPLFGTLAVLTLATSVASLAVAARALHVAGVVAASVVVAAWAAVAAGNTWGLVALLAAAGVCAFAAAWIAIADRAGMAPAAAAGAAAALFVAEGTAVASAVLAAPFAAIVGAHVVNLSAILTLTWWRRWKHIAVVAAAVAWGAALHWQIALLPATPWLRLLWLAGAIYAVFIAYPIVLGRRVQAERDPHVAAVIASAMFFFAARAALAAGHYSWMVGLVPVMESAVLAVLLRQLLVLEAPGARDLGRLALVAGAALAFVTVAIPLQLHHQWITIGWALEGAALAWLFRRIPHRGLFHSAVALLAVVFVRLALNPAIFHYEPRGSMRIFNWYLYAYVLCAAAMILAAWWLSSTEDTIFGTLRASRLLPAAGGILLFIVLNIEIADYFATGPEIAFRFGAGVSQDLTYTIGWLIFGMVLLAVGIWQRSHAARVAAVMLIAVTTFKCFLYDLRSLEGLYRVGSFVGLAVALALVSLALQKFVLARPERTA